MSRSMRDAEDPRRFRRGARPAFSQSRPALAAMLALCLGALPLAAGAQGCPRGGPGFHGGMGYGIGAGGIGMMGMRGGRLLLDPAELPALKERLGITAEQEGPWKSYAEAVGALWNFHDAMQSSMPPGPDRRAMRGQSMDEARRVHAQLWDSRTALAKALNADQRRLFDQAIPVPCARR